MKSASAALAALLLAGEASSPRTAADVWGEGKPQEPRTFSHGSRKYDKAFKTKKAKRKRQRAAGMEGTAMIGVPSQAELDGRKGHGRW